MVVAPRKNRPVTLRVSVTGSCQLRCIYCKSDKSDEKCSHNAPLTFNEIMDFVRFLKRDYGLEKVHITGGDPLCRQGLADLVGMLSDDGIDDIALTTNGQLLGKNAAALVRAGLKRITVSLDSLNPDTFGRMTRGGDLHRTLDGIETVIGHGLHPVKINTVVLKGINDHEVVDIARYGLERNCQVRFLELMPIGVAAENFNEWFIASDDVKNMLGKTFTFREEESRLSSSSRNYMSTSDTGLSGTIGFISPNSSPFCRGCRRLRLTADGDLLGCLAQNIGINLSPILRERHTDRSDGLVSAVDSALNVKHKNRHFDTEMSMVSIGG